MQNHLRINYRSGFWPVSVLSLLFLIYTCCLFLLNLELLPLALLLVAGFFLFIYECWQLRQSVIKLIRHDGKEWFTELEDKTQILELHADSYASRFLLAPVFILPADKKKHRLYLTTQNCTEADYRHLCRLLMG